MHIILWRFGSSGVYVMQTVLCEQPRGRITSFTRAVTLASSCSKICSSILTGWIGVPCHRHGGEIGCDCISWASENYWQLITKLGVFSSHSPLKWRLTLNVVCHAAAPEAVLSVHHFVSRFHNHIPQVMEAFGFLSKPTCGKSHKSSVSLKFSHSFLSTHLPDNWSERPFKTTCTLNFQSKF